MKNLILSFLYRVTQHILFWSFSIISFAIVFRLENQETQFIDIAFSLLFHLSIVIACYINLYISLPFLLKRGKYIIFILFNIGLIYGSIELNQYTFNHLSEHIFKNYMFVSQFEDAQLLIFVIVYLLGTFTLKMSKSWFILQRVNHRLSMIEKEKLSNQLKSLKSQVNPHFLFNSLNVIYSLALKNSDKTKEAILKLSDVLRYVIYDSSKDLVNIESEIKLIQDFIDLQKFRTDNFNNIKFEHQIENNLSISPLILLPLVENSFKHGINSGIEHTFLRINLKTIKTKLLFTIENNLNSELKKEIGGFGLNNIEERLKLLYPSNHKFCRFDNENSFKIEIKIWNLKA